MTLVAIPTPPFLIYHHKLYQLFKLVELILSVAQHQVLTFCHLKIHNLC